jgi:cell division protein FtsQ
VIQTAKSAPGRRQRVKRRKRILVARRQRVSRVLVSTAKLMLFVAAVAALSVAVVDYIRSAPRFTITHIAVSGNTHVTARDIIEQSGIAENQNFFRISIMDAVNAVEAIPWVERARIERVPPNEIYIEITERIPVAFVLAHRLFLIDAEGVVIDEMDATTDFDAPIITGRSIGSLEPGDSVNADGIADALEVIQIMKDTVIGENVSVSEVNIDDASNICMIAERSGTSIILGANDFEEKLWRLAKVTEAIQGDAQLMMTNLKKVDMRFNSIVPAEFTGG